MNRSRDYYRRMRAKHIGRKKKIVSRWSGFENGYYLHDGMYSKNKIHCSCCICSEKTRNNGKHVTTLSEKKSDFDLKEQINELNS